MSDPPPKRLEVTRKLHTLSQAHARAYMTRVAGRELVVFPRVHSPRYFRDSEFIVTHLQVTPGERFLEIGAGTGVVSVHAAVAGARVTATDISPEAVENTRANAERHALPGLRVLEGDLFAPLAADERFDTIFWNFPFGFEEPDESPGDAQAIIDPGYRALERFAAGAPVHLEDGGRVVLCFSPTIGNPTLLERTLAGHSYQVRTTAEETRGDVVFQLIEARR